MEVDVPAITLDTDSAIVAPYDYDPVLCHNDLNPQNILWNHHTPTLIDWEYAGIQDRYFDLASVVVEFGFDTTKREAFMTAYFQRKRWDVEKLDAYITLYQAVCQHWWDNRTDDTRRTPIREAKIENLDAIFSLVSRCTEHMLTQHIQQWDTLYPSDTLLKKDIEAQSLFVIEDSHRIIGIIVLNEDQEPEYSALNWQYTEGKALIIHRLCVAPDAQGKGIATQLMDFAEQYALENRYTTIRLDAFQENPVAVALYEKRGYHKAGVVRFRKGLFDCFEKGIDS